MIVSVLLTATACGPGGNNGEGSQCSTRADCGDGERCNAEGICTTQEASCEFASDCGVDEYCAAGTCELAACDDDSGCAAGAICDEGACRPGCRGDEDCGDGKTCSPTNVCVTAGCTTGSCPMFQACDEELSPPACVYTGDCATDAQCVAYARQVGDGEDYICSQAQETCVVKPPCGDDSDCEAGDICEPRMSDNKKVCTPGCRDNDGCRQGQVCDLQNLTCTEGCDTVDDCPNDGNDYVCHELVCVATCETRNDCMMGQVCKGSPRVCQACSQDNDCPATQICDYDLGTTEEEEMDPGLGLCADPPPTCPDDGYGDNHDENNPYAIQDVPFSTDGESPLFCQENQGGEWFAVDASSGQVIEIEMSYDNSLGNLDVALQRQGGNELVAAQEPPTVDGGTELIRFGVDLGGTFLVHVRGTITENNINYDLSVDVRDPMACVDDTLEPNDETSPAALPADMDYQDLTVCGDDADFYELDVIENQVVTVMAEAPANLGNIDLILRDSGGQQVASAETQMDKETIEVALSDPGTYVLEVRVVSGVGNVEYDLAWSQRDNNCADPYEVNDTCPADPLAPGSYTDLNVCDDSDYYQIDLLPLQTVTITATYDRAISAGDLDITLLGPGDCATLVASGQESTVGMTTEIQEEIVYQAPQGGSFNLQVFLFSGVQAEYDLEIDVSDGPPCDDDALEPNDDKAAATLIDSSLAATGDDNVLTGLKMCDTDEDWYQIDLADNDEIEFQVQFDHSRGDVDAQLIGPGDVVVAEGVSTNDDEILNYTVGAGEAGTYYLKVAAKDAARNDYWVLTYLNGTGPVDPVCPDDFENNDDRMSATSVAQGSYGLLVCGDPPDDDWFTIPMTTGQTLEVDLTFDHANGNIDLFAFDDSGSSTPVASSSTSTDNESISYTTARDQDVFWRVEAVSNEPSLPYDMDVALQPPSACSDDSYAGNTSSGDAASITAPGLYSRLTLCEGTEDWFSFDLESGADSEVFLNFDGTKADLDVFVYEASDLTTPIGTGNSTDSDESVTFTPSTTGTYYVQVAGRDNARLDYDLMLYTDTDGDGTLEGPEDRICPDAFEDNDSTLNPASIPVGTYDDLLICSPSDRDYFEVFVPGGAELTATINFTHADGDLDLQVTDPSGNTTSSSTDADTESVTVTNSGQGANYRIHVFSGSGASFNNYYQLDVGLTFADQCAEDSVAGSDQASAGSVSAGAYDLMLCEGTEDWLDLGSISSVDARIELKNELGDIDIELHDSSGVVASSTGSDNVETLSQSGLSGQHWLRVFPKNGAFIRNAYDLWLAVNNSEPAIPWCPDDFERNDDDASLAALGIPASSPTEVQVAGLLACGAEQDWYITENTISSTGLYAVGVFFDYTPDSRLAVSIYDDSDLSTPVFEMRRTPCTGDGDCGGSEVCIDTDGDNTDDTCSLTCTGDGDCNFGEQCLVDTDSDGTGDACTADDLIGEWDPADFGQYVVQVENESASGDTVETPYEVLLGRNNVYGVGCPEDSYEANDDKFNARTIGDSPQTLALGACGNNDYFEFTATTSGSMTVTALFDGTNLNFALEVLDAATLSQVSGGLDNADDGNRRSVTFDATAGESYIVGLARKRLDPADADPADGPYFLRIE